MPFGDGTNARVGINGNGEQYRERAGVPILKNFFDCKEFYCFGTKEQVVRQEISASHLVKFLVLVSRRENSRNNPNLYKVGKKLAGGKKGRAANCFSFPSLFPSLATMFTGKLPTNVDR